MRRDRGMCYAANFSAAAHLGRFLSHPLRPCLRRPCQRSIHASMATLTVTNPSGPVFYYSDVYKHPLPPKHRFPMQKYAAVRAVLEHDPLMASATFLRAPLVSVADLALVHTERYISRVLAGALTSEEIRAVGLPLTTAGIVRARASTGGTVAAAIAVLRNPSLRICGQIAGGTHHAFADHGAGFCVFNDIAVAASVALRDFPETVRKVLVVDLDTHQGDGTASIFANDHRVVTFSMHGESNYPPLKMTSDIDVGLPDGVTDHEYLNILRFYIPMLLEEHRPNLVIYQAGVDGLKGDALGRLALSRPGLSARNKTVFRGCIASNVPCVVTMGGGYTRPDIGPSVDAHADVYRDAVRAVQAIKAPRNIRIQQNE